MRIYPYLRASTDEQDATRAKAALSQFVEQADQRVSTWFVENESGATLKRPELFRLLDVAQEGDVLLIEQVDRISRLNSKDWETLKNTITAKGIIIVSLDLPTSHQFMQTAGDEFTQRMLAAVNAMLLDMLAATVRKDYDDRRRRQSEGIEKAKAEGKYRGRQINQKRHDTIAALLRDGKSYSEIVSMLSCSRATISVVKKAIDNGASKAAIALLLEGQS